MDPEGSPLLFYCSQTHSGPLESLARNRSTTCSGWGYDRIVDGGVTGQTVTVHQDDHPDGYQFAAMLCFFIFANSLVERIEGHEETAWFWLSSGSWGLIFVSGVLSLVCQLLSGIAF